MAEKVEFGRVDDREGFSAGRVEDTKEEEEIGREMESALGGGAETGLTKRVDGAMAR